MPDAAPRQIPITRVMAIISTVIRRLHPQTSELLWPEAKKDAAKEVFLHT
jgi:hypothetical protein